MGLKSKSGGKQLIHGLQAFALMSPAVMALATTPVHWSAPCVATGSCRSSDTADPNIMMSAKKATDAIYLQHDHILVIN